MGHISSVCLAYVFSYQNNSKLFGEGDSETLLSVLLPTMNSERWLRESISSIVGQEFQNFELIIVDNHSDDKTVNIVHSIADSRIILLKQSGGQLASALNEGIARASGEFIARQDGDDISSPQRFFSQIRFLMENPDVDLVGCRFWSIDTEGRIVKGHRPPKTHEKICDKLLHHMAFAGPSILARRNLFKKLKGYDTRFDGLLGEDYDLVVRASENGELATVPEYLYYYRTGNPNSMCGRADYDYEPYQRIVRERAIARGNSRFVEAYG